MASASSSYSSSSPRRPKPKPKVDWNAANRSKLMSPDVVMEEIESAIAATEYEHASRHLKAAACSDVEAADRAFRSARTAVAKGDFEVGMELSQLALLNCPPHKTNAISKIQTLIAHMKQQRAASTEN
jgi:hypothetical protein|uniref:Uncharacterized protein n=1 Tax=Picea sitchensis TaxID=3332 RepID=A9NNH1_PICSI|nr:unknown [Picea sitchensis]